MAQLPRIIDDISWMKNLDFPKNVHQIFSLRKLHITMKNWEDGGKKRLLGLIQLAK